MSRPVATYGIVLVSTALACVGPSIPTVTGSASVSTSSADTTGPTGTLDPSSTGATGTSSTARSESSSSTGTPAEEDVAPALARVVCELSAACGCPNYDALKCVLDTEGVVAQWQADAIAAGLSFNEACWAQWLDAYRGPDCSPALEAPCSVYAGPDEVGDACTSYGPLATTCVASSPCGLDGPGVRCLPSEPPRFAEGEACVNAYGLCDADAGLVCDFSSGVCRSPRVDGAPCEDGYCGGTDLWCDEEDDDGPVCKLRAPPGASCELGQSCASGICDGVCVDVAGRVCFFRGF